MDTEHIDRTLSDLDVFTETDIQLLAEYNILTVDPLLGPTKGLINSAIFDLMEDGEDKLHRFIILIPFEIIKKYREFEEEHPMGLIKDEEIENDE